MSKSQAELGANVHIDARSGFAGHRWKGMSREGTQSTISDQNVWLAENVRLKRGKFVVRGGQTKVNASPLSTIDGVFDAGDIGAPSTMPRIGFGGGSAPGLYIFGGGGGSIKPAVWKYDGATLASIGTAVSNGMGTALANVGNALVFSAGTDYPSKTVCTIETLIPSSEVWSSWASVGTVSNNVDGLLYLPDDVGGDRLLMALRAITGYSPKSSVYSYDGTSWTTEFTIAGVPGNEGQEHIVMTGVSPGDATTAGSVFVIGWDGSQNTIYERLSGGTGYAAKNYTGGPYGGLIPLSAYMDSVGFAWFGVNISGTYYYVRFPGLSNTDEAQVLMSPGSAVSGSPIVGEFGNFNYFGFGSSSGACSISRLPLSTWNNPTLEFDFAAGFPADSLNIFRNMCVYNGSLYALCGNRSVPSRMYLYKSAGSDTTSWSKIGEVTDLSGAFSTADYAPQHMVAL